MPLRTGVCRARGPAGAKNRAGKQGRSIGESSPGASRYCPSFTVARLLSDLAAVIAPFIWKRGIGAPTSATAVGEGHDRWALRHCLVGESDQPVRLERAKHPLTNQRLHQATDTA
jgi:hypothetical protein